MRPIERYHKEAKEGEEKKARRRVYGGFKRRAEEAMDALNKQWARKQKRK